MAKAKKQIEEVAPVEETVVETTPVEETTQVEQVIEETSIAKDLIRAYFDSAFEKLRQGGQNSCFSEQQVKAMVEGALNTL